MTHWETTFFPTLSTRAAHWPWSSSRGERSHTSLHHSICPCRSHCHSLHFRNNTLGCKVRWLETLEKQIKWYFFKTAQWFEGKAAANGQLLWILSPKIARPTEHHLAADQSPYIQQILDLLLYYLTYKHKRSIDPHIPPHHEKQGIINCSVKSAVLLCDCRTEYEYWAMLYPRGISRNRSDPYLFIYSACSCLLTPTETSHRLNVSLQSYLSPVSQNTWWNSAKK